MRDEVDNKMHGLENSCRQDSFLLTMSRENDYYLPSPDPPVQGEASSSSSAQPQIVHNNAFLQQTDPYHHQPIPDRVEDSETDPQWTKLTSSVWKRAGQVQALLGQWSGIEEWQSSGRSTESWADEAYKKAEEQLQAGAPSWTHGEYERILGILGTVIGHVAGDPEMEAQSRLRSRQGLEEIERSKH